MVGEYVFRVSEGWISGHFHVAAAVSAAPERMWPGAAETAATTQKRLTSDGGTRNTYVGDAHPTRVFAGRSRDPEIG